ncbi:hypothetical protein FI667_g11503, partial [Globisporangium splendens]
MRSMKHVLNAAALSAVLAKCSSMLRLRDESAAFVSFSTSMVLFSTIVGLNEAASDPISPADVLGRGGIDCCCEVCGFGTGFGGTLADNGTLSSATGTLLLARMGELSPRISTGGAAACLAPPPEVDDRFNLASPPVASLSDALGVAGAAFSLGIAGGAPAFPSLGLAPSSTTPGLASAFGGGAELGGAFVGGGFVLGGAPTGFASAAPDGGGLADGGCAAPRIFATDALGATPPLGGGPLGGGNDDFARKAAAAFEFVPCGGGLEGGGNDFFGFFLSSPS